MKIVLRCIYPKNTSPLLENITSGQKKYLQNTDKLAHS
ncbi:MAG: hypothetical protein JSC188_001034 [Candidatus Tokpelaia sp. JSC188]|nr:MAG: hypothetical protein JSC188_001034 [Candidatus Tokpelaia sp. JSC188]